MKALEFSVIALGPLGVESPAHGDPDVVLESVYAHPV